MEEGLKDNVVGLMSGGDRALISSIEGFEDSPEYGARTLDDFGFGPGDLLIASTEGGETPIVIGAVNRAAEVAGPDTRPFFLFCNPPEILREKVIRSREVLEDERVRKICLAHGP